MRVHEGVHLAQHGAAWHDSVKWCARAHVHAGGLACWTRNAKPRVRDLRPVQTHLPAVRFERRNCSTARVFLSLYPQPLSHSGIPAVPATMPGTRCHGRHVHRYRWTCRDSSQRRAFQRWAVHGGQRTQTGLRRTADRARYCRTRRRSHERASRASSDTIRCCRPADRRRSSAFGARRGLKCRPPICTPFFTKKMRAYTYARILASRLRAMAVTHVCHRCVSMSALMFAHTGS